MILPLEKQVCSRELSIELKKLGFFHESLFYWAPMKIDGKDDWFLAFRNNFSPEDRDFRDWYSAYTASELGEFLKEYPCGSGTYIHYSKDYKSFCVDYIDGTHSETMADALAVALVVKSRNGSIERRRP